VLQKTMVIKIIDSTTADLARVIHVFGGSGRKVYARLTGLIRISVRKMRKLHPTLKVHACRLKRILGIGTRRIAVVTRVKKPLLYRDGTTVYFSDNAAITFGKKRKFGGKRFYGVSTRFVGYFKISRRFKMNI
jgi:ribosomal protein L14